jgi:2-polyprenyl-6-methoxyphenol hydroxylase-like FAD-dependent oxidoreductase
VVKEISARLVVCADGRSSAGRRWSPRFDVKQDPPFLVITGLLLENMHIPEDTGTIYLNATLGQSAYTFPQGGGRVRAYLAYPVTSGFRLQGEKDLPRFVEESIRAGAPAGAFEGVRGAGPLASFDAADTWVECPYAEGIVLIGDAASSNDPSWGQGLSLTLRDVRVLRDRLLAASDWDAACRDYAREHSRYYGVIHEVTLALKDMFQRPGPQADAWRSRALPLIAQDPARVPDHVFSGPDLPWMRRYGGCFSPKTWQRRARPDVYQSVAMPERAARGSAQHGDARGGVDRAASRAGVERRAGDRVHAAGAGNPKPRSRSGGVGVPVAVSGGFE